MYTVEIIKRDENGNLVTTVAYIKPLVDANRAAAIAQTAGQYVALYDSFGRRLPIKQTVKVVA